MAKNKINPVIKSLPKIAIIGRPNVGKSTLLNRLIKKRKAIIDPTPGVTRDRTYHEIETKGKQFILIDTGGMTLETDDAFKASIFQQANIALEEADILVFLLDVQGIAQDDYEIANLIRKSHKPIILGVNKVDNGQRAELLPIFYELGLGDPVGFSALHGHGVSNLLNLILEKIPDQKNNKVDYSQQQTIIPVSIIGKPNVGKSSLLNALLGFERSIVSPVPGTTRDSIEEQIQYKNRIIQFVDTAGIRRRTKIQDGIEYYSVNRAMKSIEASDVVIHLIDSMENLSDQDKKILGLAMDMGKASIIALSKWDLIPDGDKALRYFREWIKFRFGSSSYIPIIRVSAINNLGMNAMLNHILSLYDKYHLRIETSVLNKTVQALLSQHSPSTKKGKLNIKYITQVEVAPPKLVFFVNRPELFSDNYKKYFINRLREEFKLDGIPIIIKIKKQNA